MKSNKNIAVFIDRDGTISEEVGYLNNIDRLKLIKGTSHAIKLLNKKGLKAIVVTNQAGVARGYFPESLVQKAHDRLREMLRHEGAALDGIYYCPHHPTAGESEYTMMCDCRKPGTGLLDKAADDLAIDLSRSYVVGDKWSDIELAHRAGARAVLVRTGFATDDPGNVRPEHVRDPDLTAHDLGEAAEWIVRQRA